MGSDMYISIEVRHDGPGRDPSVWSRMWQGPSGPIARGIVVKAFGDCPDGGVDTRTGYLSRDEVLAQQETMFRCPWRFDEPYWVRLVHGDEFCDIVRERRWKSLQGGDYADMECGPELRGFAAMVAALMADGVEVRVWCWHSQ